MKLVFHGHEERYAVEQSLLNFFPEERPVYDGDEEKVICDIKIKYEPLKSVIDDEVAEKYFFSEKAVAGMMRNRDSMNKGRAQDITKPCNTVGAHLAKVSLNSTDPVLFVDGRYFVQVEKE